MQLMKWYIFTIKGIKIFYVFIILVIAFEIGPITLHDPTLSYLFKHKVMDQCWKSLAGPQMASPTNAKVCQWVCSFSISWDTARSDDELQGRSIAFKWRGKHLLVGGGVTRRTRRFLWLNWAGHPAYALAETPFKWCADSAYKVHCRRTPAW